MTFLEDVPSECSFVRVYTSKKRSLTALSKAYESSILSLRDDIDHTLENYSLHLFVLRAHPRSPSYASCEASFCNV